MKYARLPNHCLAITKGGMRLAHKAPFWTYEAAGEAQQMKLITKAAARIASQSLQKKLSFARDWYYEECRKARKDFD